MGSLATLLADAGHEVSGSDPEPRPPMSDVLEARGIRILPGWHPRNVERLPRDTVVVVGNVCRRDNPEAVRAAELDLRRVSMPGAIAELVLPGRRSLVVAGTHGKTTTTSVLAALLLRAELDPTVVVGGVSRDLGGSSRFGRGPFLVIEGDEYDSAYFEKVPKFWSYGPWAAILTSVEHDHLDIYPDVASYERAFAGLVDRVDPGGLIAVWAGDERAVALARGARCRVIHYALRSDAVPPSTRPVYTAVLHDDDGPGRLRLDVQGPEGGLGTLSTPLAGEHNARNVLAAAVVAHEVCGLSWEQISRGLARFQGIALRQELVGTARNVRVYRDFAHHPGAVAETLRAMRPLALPGRLVAAFEPRSATACRRLHQQDYVQAFSLADAVVLAPVGRPEIPAGDRLDTEAVAEALRRRSIDAVAAVSLDRMLELLLDRVGPGDLVLLMSNGAFGQLDRRLLERLAEVIP
jgi:UDP-N-acetylmuramate: L-alanyl-gamma-D-glutamyl-meso-diaminopimelate ligase